MQKPHPVPTELLIAYVAEELGRDESDAITAHVAGCIECTSIIAHFRLVRRYVRLDNTVDVPRATLEQAQRLFDVRPVT